MKSNKLYQILFFGFNVVALSAFGNEGIREQNSCPQALYRRLGSNPAIVKDENGSWKLARQPLEYGADGRPEGRGFLGSYPPKSFQFEDPTFKKFIDQNGIIYWRQMIKVFPSFKEVRDYLLSAPRRYQSGKFDPLQRHLFFIAGSDFDRIKKMVISSEVDETRAKAIWKEHGADHQKVFQKMLMRSNVSAKDETSLYYVSETIQGSDGRPDFVYKSLAKAELPRFDFNFDTLNRFTDFTSNGRTDLVYEFWGWVKVPVRGVVKLEDFFANTEKVREFERLARKYQKDGIVGSITFNTVEGMTRVIELARDQFRRGQGEGGTTYSHSRFSPKFIDSQIAGLKNGTTFSVEVRSPSGEVIGGCFGALRDGVVYSDSIAYPILLKWKKDQKGNILRDDQGNMIPLYETHKDGSLRLDDNGNPVQSIYGVEVAKIGKYFLFQKLLKAGFLIQDSIMVSAFTEAIGGDYISGQEFAGIVQNAKARNVDLRIVDWSAVTEMPAPRKAEGSRK